MSIARAVVEHIADKDGGMGCKTLFATHYHELTDLENAIDGVKNYNIAVKKRGDDITFLRRIVRGPAAVSYTHLDVYKRQGSGDRHEQQRGQTEQKAEQEPQRIKSGKEKNENGKDDAKDKADDNRDDVIAFRVAHNIAPLS